MPPLARLSIPPRVFSLLLNFLLLNFLLLNFLLLNLTGAAGAELRDAGYGDGSFVDSQGNYYYPQPNGSYIDTYGAAFDAIGDGLYSDALGNTIDTGPDPSGHRPPGNTGAGGHRVSVPGKAASGHDATAVTPGVDGPGGPADAAVRAGNADFGPRYLEDVGDGYLNLTPGDLPPEPAPDPRESDRAADSGAVPDILGEAFDVPHLETGADIGESPTLDDSALNGEGTGPRRRDGPVQSIPQRQRSTDR